jgi:hypothetical protein
MIAGDLVLANESAGIGAGFMSADKSALSNLRGTNHFKMTPI